MSIQLGDIFYRFLVRRLKKYMQAQLNPRNVGSIDLLRDLITESPLKCTLRFGKEYFDEIMDRRACEVHMYDSNNEHFILSNATITQDSLF